MHDAQIDTLLTTLVQSQKITEQSELQAHLKARGHDIPQATISRRLKKLKIAKVGGVYQVVDMQPLGLPVVLNMQSSDNGLIVLHTHPGQASSLAYYIDRRYVAFHPNDEKQAGILGTIAGDDTILIILKSEKYAQDVLNKLGEDLGFAVHHMI